MSRRASILVALLWCVAFLSLLVVGVLHTVTLELRVAKNFGDRIQAHYLALAGVEKAKAVLFHDAQERKRSRVHHTKTVYDNATEFREISLGRGHFSIIRQGAPGEAQGMVYGVSDEESRLNINYAGADELAKLTGMTPEMVAGLIDYRDKDNAVTQGGGEADEYTALVPPYLPYNGPLRTSRELLMVRNFSRTLLLGEDANQNGLLDPEENDGADSEPDDNADGILDPGWSALFAVDSAVRNVNAAGQGRMNLQQADEQTLTTLPGVTADLAKAIVQHRSQNRFETILDLLEVRAPAPNNAPAPPPPSPNNPGSPGTATRPTRAVATPTPGTPSSTGRSAGGATRPTPPTPARSQGPPLIDEQMFIDLADEVTIEDELEAAGVVNVNTAGIDVLACLPGLDRELAQAIVNYRSSSGFFANTAALLKVPGVTQEILKRLLPRITTRSETFRILAEGRVPSSNARQRLQVIVRVGNFYVDTLAYREDDL